MKIVAIGSHPDDIEIGVGGTAALHSQKNDDVVFVVVTSGSATGMRPEKREQEAREGAKELGVEDTRFLRFEDTRVPYNDTLIKDIEEIIHEVNPDRVYTHIEEDTHQDHKKTALATIAAARNVSDVYAYESPSTRPSFSPQSFITFDREILDRKIRAIRSHETQSEKDALDAEAMEGLARFRGRQANHRFAESFQIIRSTESLTQ